MNKLIIGSFFAIGLLLGCKKKDKEPELLEYFSFTANGVDYYYPQDVRYGFGTSRRAIFAIKSGNTGFFIEAGSFENLTAEGTFRFTFFPGDQLPQQDTIILDGVNNKVNLIGFLKQGNNYQHYTSLPGKIIFTERSNEKLTGTFEFEIEQYLFNMSTGIEWTGNILHITNGKFSIIPSN